MMPASGAQDHLFIQGEACDDSSTNDIVINGKQSTRPFTPNSNGGKIQDLLIIFLSFPQFLVCVIMFREKGMQSSLVNTFHSLTCSQHKLLTLPPRFSHAPGLTLLARWFKMKHLFSNYWKVCLGSLCRRSRSPGKG